MTSWWTAPAALQAVAILCLLAPGQARDAPPMGSLTLRGCPEKCGDVTVPYPFGIGENCSLPGFELRCNRTSKGELLPLMDSGSSPFTTPVVSISLLPTQVRVLVSPFSTCALDENSTFRSSEFSLRYPYTFSSTANVLTVLGCNTLAYTYVERQPLGCASLCSNGSLHDDGKCSGVGCCQVDMPQGLYVYGASMSHVTLPVVPGYISVSDPRRGSGSVRSSPRRGHASPSETKNYCGSVFVSERGKYVFKQADASMNISYRTYPVVLDWFIKDSKNCSEAQANDTTFACKSLHSVCHDSATGTGYSCQCSLGFLGNPYLPNGCRDINECEDPYICKAGRVCNNTPGNYTCVCPIGTVHNRMYDYCMKVGSDSHRKITSGIALGFGSSCGLLSLIAYCTIILVQLQKRREEQNKKTVFKKNHDMLLKQQLRSCDGDNIIERVKIFPLHDLERATNKFIASCVVGKGGHGIVYKALLNLRVVAIKMSKVTSQSEIEQFINEVVLLSQVNHRNIVKFIGCCLETEVPLLVFEFISNGTLFDHLHTRTEENLLSWIDCLRIATEITSALVYLHSAANISIFHRDIKTSNILLDEKLTAKLSDFGASKSVTFDQTHITTNVQGTWGYIDPEYMQTCQLTEKTDVYSLGVILVELLTGQNPTSRLRFQEAGSLVSSFILAMQENRLLDVVDHSILGDINAEEVEIFARLALTSLNINGKDRPTMKYILSFLENLLQINKNKGVISISENESENKKLFLDMPTLLSNDTITTNWSLQMHTSFID